MDIKSLLTKLGFRVDFTKLNQYEKRIEQTSRKLDALAQKMGGKWSKAAEKASSEQVKSQENATKKKGRLLEYELRIRAKLAQKERSIAEKTLNEELKIRQRLARFQEKLAEKSKNLAEKTAQQEQRIKERAFERAARIREKEASRENRLSDKVANYELKVRERLARMKEKIAQRELRDQEKATQRGLRMREKALNEELKIRERLARQKEKIEAREERRRERAEEKNKRDVERGATATFMGGGLLTRFLGRGTLGMGKKSGELEAQLNVVQALGELDNSGRKDMEKLMEQLVQDNRFNPLETLEGMSELARAGFKKEGLLQLTPTSLDFATATGDKSVNFEKASKLLTDMMFTFGMSLSDAPKIADILVTAMNESKLNFDDFSYALKYSAGSANAAGMNLEQLSALVAIEAQKGLKGSVGGTGLRSIITNASIAGKDLNFRSRQKQTLDTLGIKAFDPVTDRMDLLTVFKELGGKLEGKSRGEKLNTFYRLFGKTAQNQAFAVMESLKQPEMITMIDTIMNNHEGKTKQVKGIINQGYSFDTTKMMNNLDLVEKKIGDSVNPVLEKFLDLITRISQEFVNADPKVHKLTGGILLLGTALAGLVTATAGLALLKIGLGFLAPAMWAVVLPGLKLAAIVGIIALLALAVEDFVSTLQGKDTVLKDIVNGMNAYFKDKLGVDIPAVFDKIIAAKDKLIDGFYTVKDAIRNAFESVKTYLHDNFYQSFINFINKIKGGVDNFIPGLGGKIFAGSAYSPQSYNPSTAPYLSAANPGASQGGVNIGNITTQVQVNSSNATPSQISAASSQGTSQGVAQVMQKHSLNYSPGY